MRKAFKHLAVDARKRCIYAFGRLFFIRCDTQIRRGHADRSAESFAVQHFSGHHIRSAAQTRKSIEVASIKRRIQHRYGNRFAVFENFFAHHNRNAELLRRFSDGRLRALCGGALRAIVFVSPTIAAHNAGRSRFFYKSSRIGLFFFTAGNQHIKTAVFQQKGLFFFGRIYKSPFGRHKTYEDGRSASFLCLPHKRLHKVSMPLMQSVKAPERGTCVIRFFNLI